MDYPKFLLQPGILDMLTSFNDFIEREISLPLPKIITEITHIQEKNILICCGKTYSNIGNLKRHRSKHIKDKLYKCNKCIRKFYDNSSLDIHKKIHQKIIKQEYICGICPKILDNFTLLEKHRDSHYNKCKLCNKKFINKISFQTHLQFHEKNGCFKCKKCNKIFGRGYNLTRHEKSIHPEML